MWVFCGHVSSLRRLDDAEAVLLHASFRILLLKRKHRPDVGRHTLPAASAHFRLHPPLHHHKDCHMYLHTCAQSQVCDVNRSDTLDFAHAQSVAPGNESVRVCRGEDVTSRPSEHQCCITMLHSLGASTSDLLEPLLTSRHAPVGTAPTPQWRPY